MSLFTKRQVISTVALSVALFGASTTWAATITATGSGNWSSTTPDAPWPGGALPGINDNVVVANGFVVTVDVPESIYGAAGLEVDDTAVVINNSSLTVGAGLSGSGTFTQGAGSTLSVGGNATYGIAHFQATATGNTVIYPENSFFAAHTNYYNVQFMGFGTFYNGNTISPDETITVYGSMTLGGTTGLQVADTFTIMGDLTIGAGITVDPSCFNFTVGGTTYVSGSLKDFCGNAGLSDMLHNVTVLPGGLWDVGDTTNYGVSGSITNFGTIQGSAYGSITLGGTGVIAGNNLTIPQLYLFGTYEVKTPITIGQAITLDGELTMDISSAGVLGSISIDPNANYGSIAYGGDLHVKNLGGYLKTGSVYKLFGVPDGWAYNGSFNTESFPYVLPSLYFEDNMNFDGTIDIAGVSVAPPVLNSVKNGANLTLSWDAATYPGFTVLALTNSAGIKTSGWSDAGSGGVSPFPVHVDTSKPAVFFTLGHPL